MLSQDRNLTNTNISFISALCVIFGSNKSFNIHHPSELASTLEFLQRSKGRGLLISWNLTKACDSRNPVSVLSVTITEGRPAQLFTLTFTVCCSSHENTHRTSILQLYNYIKWKLSTDRSHTNSETMVPEQEICNWARIYMKKILTMPKCAFIYFFSINPEKGTKVENWDSKCRLSVNPQVLTLIKELADYEWL